MRLIRGGFAPDCRVRVRGGGYSSSVLHLQGGPLDSPHHVRPACTPSSIAAVPDWIPTAGCPVRAASDKL